MQKCIFCKSETGIFTTREHILPESLGGGNWAILPDGLLCDKCQNHFGSSIEQQALADYPFTFFRVFLGIPTKKGKAPWFNSWEGTIRASVRTGSFDYEPSELFENVMQRGHKSQIRLLAHPLKPHMVCRFLLKMGLEVIAADNPQDIFNKKFDKARLFALTGEKSDEWWYLQHEDISAANSYIRGGMGLEEWGDNIKLQVVMIDAGAEVFHLKLLYIDLLTPLEVRIKPPPKETLSEPEYRLFTV